MQAVILSTDFDTFTRPSAERLCWRQSLRGQDPARVATSPLNQGRGFIYSSSDEDLPECEVDMRCLQPTIPRSPAHSINFQQALPTQSSSLLGGWHRHLFHSPPHLPIPTRTLLVSLSLHLNVGYEYEGLLQQR